MQVRLSVSNLCQIVVAFVFQDQEWELSPNMFFLSKAIFIYTINSDSRAIDLKGVLAFTEAHPLYGLLNPACFT